MLYSRSWTCSKLCRAVAILIAIRAFERFLQLLPLSRRPFAPLAQNARFFAANIRGAKLVILPGEVGHYTFLDAGTAAGKKQLPQFFVDNPGVGRVAVHRQVAQMAVRFFEKELAEP